MVIHLGMIAFIDVLFAFLLKTDLVFETLFSVLR